jgi:hypothetical protein
MKGTVWSLFFDLKEGILYWKPDPGSSKESRRWNTRYAGKAAGSPLSEGNYLTIKLKRLGIYQIYVHRIIYEMSYGPIPEGMFVDHINHNRQDNRPCNLRLVTRAENNRNASKRSDNTSGYTGVNWSNAHGVWVARIQVDGKRKFLGYFESLEDAVFARSSCVENKMFHDNHGEENERDSI